MKILCLNRKVRFHPAEVIGGLPAHKVKKGDEVEVIILERNSSKTVSDSYPLKGTVISYEEPFEPATSPDDWEVLK
ncbi:MAG: hypothetical protein QNJ41_29370 [Xenococcaceae cyanobacterium MO_188.B32]|nr:hypothetical protein [Xenococcaceae cyanobacterium MO_188.B32]